MGVPSLMLSFLLLGSVAGAAAAGDSRERVPLMRSDSQWWGQDSVTDSDMIIKTHPQANVALNNGKQAIKYHQHIPLHIKIENKEFYAKKKVLQADAAKKQQEANAFKSQNKQQAAIAANHMAAPMQNKAASLEQGKGGVMKTVKDKMAWFGFESNDEDKDMLSAPSPLQEKWSKQFGGQGDSTAISDVSSDSEETPDEEHSAGDADPALSPDSLVKSSTAHEVEQLKEEVEQLKRAVRPTAEQLTPAEVEQPTPAETEPAAPAPTPSHLAIVDNAIEGDAIKPQAVQEGVRWSEHGPVESDPPAPAPAPSPTPLA